MRRSRVSISGLMGGVLVASVGVAALRFATERWAGAFALLTLAALGYSALAAAFGPRGDRAAWAGFALFGWGYWTLALSPWWGESFRPQLATSTLLDDARQAFASRGLGPMTLEDAVSREFQANARVVKLTAELRAARDRAQAARRSQDTVEEGDLLAVKAETEVYLIETEYRSLWENLRVRLTESLAPSFAKSPLLIEPFLRVGHNLLALSAGALGAMAGKRLARRREELDGPDLPEAEESRP